MEDFKYRYCTKEDLVIGNLVHGTYNHVAGEYVTVENNMQVPFTRLGEYRIFDGYAPIVGIDGDLIDMGAYGVTSDSNGAMVQRKIERHYSEFIILLNPVEVESAILYNKLDVELWEETKDIVAYDRDVMRKEIKARFLSKMRVDKLVGFLKSND